MPPKLLKQCCLINIAGQNNILDVAVATDYKHVIMQIVTFT